MIIKVPRKVKMASHTYGIKCDSRQSLSAGTCGLTRHIYQEIIMDPSWPLSQKNQTLLHEVMHLIERFWVVKLDDNDIDRIAEGLAVFLFDNLGIELDWSDVDLPD